MRMRMQILVAAAVALVAVSCSSGSDADSPASTEPEVSQTGTAADSPAPEGTTDASSTTEAAPETTGPEADELEPQAAEALSGGRFVYANPYSFTDLDPASAFSSEHVLLQNVYETLTRLDDPEAPASEQLVGVLAESWTSNDDARTPPGSTGATAPAPAPT